MFVMKVTELRADFDYKVDRKMCNFIVHLPCDDVIFSMRKMPEEMRPERTRIN